MEEDSERESGGSSFYDAGQGLSIFDLIDSIQKIAANNARSQLNSETNLLLFLRSWWSDYYNRPMKDPILEQYTLEELIYEFYDKIERKAAKEEAKEKAEEKVEEIKEREAIDWAEKMEQEELEAAAAKNEPKQPNPAADPENIKWMEDQIAMAKQSHGESFGEDIDISF